MERLVWTENSESWTRMLLQFLQMRGGNYSCQYFPLSLSLPQLLGRSICFQALWNRVD